MSLDPTIEPYMQRDKLVISTGEVLAATHLGIPIEDLAYIKNFTLVKQAGSSAQVKPDYLWPLDPPERLDFAKFQDFAKFLDKRLEKQKPNPKKKGGKL